MDAGIGMRRLSIIDLGTGHQPITNEDGTVWIVFNGEIYNYLELRADLESRGHRFRTNSDTETILHLYEEYGIDGIQRLRGMFAYAIWDSNKRQLLLVRDRFGKKPLYFTKTSDGLYFGSELKCLKAAGVPLDLDPEALKLYLQFMYVPEPWSIFRQARKVAPGGVVALHGRRASARRPLLDVAHAGHRASEWDDPSAGAGAADGTVRRIRAHPHDGRRSVGRVPQRRHRFERGGWRRWRCNRQIP